MMCDHFRVCSYGQFDMAKETFDVVSDFESMLDLFICHLNPSALRLLVQKLERDGTNPELQRQCEKILSIRSAGWGQGMFANFAARGSGGKMRDLAREHLKERCKLCNQS